MDSIQDIELPEIKRNEVNVWTTKAIEKYTPDPSTSQSLRLEFGHLSSHGFTDGTKDELEEKEHFPDDLHYIFSACGLFIGFGNFISFPNLVFTKGGLAFLIPYTVSTLIVSVPIFFIETAWGQLIHCKLNQKMAIIHPRLWGVGAGMAALGFLICCFYPSFFPWFLSYFIDSFSSPFPWEKETEMEGLAWNTKYFKQDVLQISDSIDDRLRFIPYLVLLLIITYIIMYGVVRKGLNSTSEVVFYTVPIPFFLLVLLIVKGFILEGSLLGIKAFFKPDWSVLYSFEVWELAFSQCVFQVALTDGVVMHLGSNRKPDSKIVLHSFWMPFFDFLVSLIAALSIYAFLGHVSHKTGVPVEDLTKSGLDLPFIAYPGLVSTFKLARLWAIVFFLMMLLIGVDSIFGVLEFQIAYLWDCCPKAHQKMSKETFSGLVCFMFFCLGSFFMTNNGWWYFLIFIKNVGGWAKLFLAILEMVSIGGVFGLEKFEAMLYFRTGERIPKFIRACILFVVPSVNAVIVIRSVAQEVRIEGASFWGEVINKSLRLLPIVIILIGVAFPYKGPSAETLIKRQYGHSTDELVAIFRQEMADPRPVTLAASESQYSVDQPSTEKKIIIQQR